jgi:hypothetical protein
MDDLLSQFEALLNRYIRATEIHQSARSADGIRDARRFLSNEAIELCDFLIEHGPTVTFVATPPDSGHAFDPHANYVKVKGGWERKDAPK